MKLKCLTLVMLMLCLLAGTAMSATVGKITGVITDSQTKEPLVGVSVSVVGTTMGAMTNEDGQYNIMNVPVGTYVLKLTAVGYATVEISNVEVSADLATYQNETMSSQATDLGKTIQVTTERPLVLKDKTTTVNIVKRDELLAMPTRGFDQVVGIQNSVVRMQSNVDVRQRGQREPVGGTGSELNLRGGRPSEVAYYVDGFSQQDPLTGNSTTNINNNAIKEVQVTSGAFSAEYGNVASGIVNVTTNSGSNEYHGNAEIVTDNLVGSSRSYDNNYYSADFGGPIPGTEKGYFFLSGEKRWLGDREPSSRTDEIWEEYGLSERFDGTRRLPNNSLDGYSLQGKIDYNFTPNLKLGLSGNGSRDKWQEFRQIFLFIPEHNPRYDDKNLGLNAKITHTLNSKTFYNLSASYFKTSRFRGDGVVGEDLAAYNRPFANPEEDTVDLFWEDSLRYVYQSTGDTTYNEAYWPGYLKRKSSYVGFKGDITSNWAPEHTLKAGIDFQRHTLRFFEHLDATLGYRQDLLNRYGYDSLGNETDDDDFKNNVKHPINLGLFIEDRFEWQNLIVSFGLRFDYFDYKALRIKNLQYPLDFTGGTDLSLDREDLEESKKFKRLSPRLGIAFPVSDKTQLHVNYGKFFQRPDLRRLYLGYDFLEARITAGSYYPFASPNLEPEKTTQYEVGITHQLGATTAIDITAYYKDVQDLTQIFHQSPASPRTYDYFANIDFGTIKGVDIGLNMRRTNHISLDLKYTLSYASGTGSYAQSHYIIAWQNPEGAPKRKAPLDYDQRHALAGIIDYRLGKSEGPKFGDTYILENFGINVIVQASSGTPYTPIQVDNEITEAAFTPLPIGSINSARLPWTWQVDFKAERIIPLGKYSLVPYLVVKNLLDRDNVVSVYEGTGKPNETGWLGTAAGQDWVSSHDTYLYNLKQDNPKNYGAPRQILFGLRMSF
ncbi:MAG: TonB-dependent receptor [bacterium]|nr:TonB-dependent receptor [bacterium]